MRVHCLFSTWPIVTTLRIPYLKTYNLLTNPHRWPCQVLVYNTWTLNTQVSCQTLQSSGRKLADIEEDRQEVVLSSLSHISTPRQYVNSKDSMST